jgi:hypothetical protein
MAELTSGYGKLVEQELKSLVWFVEHNRVIEAYKTATEVIKDLSYDAHSIEDFCYVLDSGVDIPYLISGPAGIYVAALCNHVAEDKIVLRLDEMRRTLHFLGYRLPYGKSLRIEGDTGNFTGSALQGGDITVTGATGDWTGAGMTEGKFLSTKIAVAIPANGCRVERFGLAAASEGSAVSLPARFIKLERQSQATHYFER